MKNCQICGDEFQEYRKNQKYCRVCGKDSTKARVRYERALMINKIHAGDFDKPFEVTCTECDKKILTTRNRRFCSDVCAESHRIRTAKCPVCLDILSEKGNMKGRGFCSDSCKQKNQLKRAIESGNHIPCDFCGKKFIRKGYSNRFCSNDCYNNHREKEKEEKKESVPKNPIKRVREMKCEHCGSIFLWKIESAGQRFCTKECRKEKEKKEKEKSIEKLNLGKELHICTVCKTPQKNCERFTSNFVYSPKGAVGKTINGKYIIVQCPKFK